MNKSEMKEDKYYRKARFEDLNSIQIGKYFLYENDLQNYFGDDEESIILLKRVFQKEYKITRTSSGLPRVPSRLEDKQRIIQLLQTYFNRLRRKIVEKRSKSGDSISLRENIDGIQQIKLLIDHFEESTETFPYHMFKDYLDNKEYIKSTGDVNKQMREFQFNKSQNERIRNLLRQFSILYLKDKKKEQFEVRDPGVYSERFNEFMKGRDVNKLPPILRDLLKLLDGKYSVVAQEEEKIRDEIYEPEKVYSELERLLEEIDEQVETQKGGGKPIIDRIRGTKGLDEQVTAVVDYIVEKYKQLHQAHKHVILNKDQEYSMLDEESAKKILDLQEKLNKAETDLSIENVENSKLREQIAKVNNEIIEKNDEIEAKNAEIKQLNVTMRSQYTSDVIVKDLIQKVTNKQNELDELQTDKKTLEEELNSLKPKLIKKESKVAELEAEITRVNDLLKEQNIELDGNKVILDRYKDDIQKLRLDLSGNSELLDESKVEIKDLKNEISRKDAMILDLSKNLIKTKNELNSVNKEADGLMQSSINDVERLNDEIDRINKEKRRLETEVNECRETLTTKLTEQQAEFSKKIDTLKAEFESSDSKKLKLFTEQLKGFEQRIIGMDALIQEYDELNDQNENESTDLKANLARITAERDSLRNENKSLEDKLKSLESSIASSTGASSELSKQLDSVQKEKDALDEKLRAKETEVAELRSRLSSKDEELERIKNEYMAKLNDLNSANSLLQKEVSTLKESETSLRTTASTLQDYLKQIQTLTTEKTDNLKLMEQFQNSLDEKFKIISELETEKNILNAKIQELTRINKSLTEKNDELNDQIKEFEVNKVKLESSEQKIKDLVNKIDELTGEFDKEKKNIEYTMTQQITNINETTIKEKTDLLKKISELEGELKETEADRKRYLEANDSITKTNDEFKKQINDMRKKLDTCKLGRDRPVQSTQTDGKQTDETPVIDKNKWLIEIKKLFKDNKFSYGVRKNYDFLRTAQSYIADTSDLKYEDLGMMLNYIINTLGSLPPTSIIYDNPVMQDLDIKSKPKITLLSVVEDIKKLASEYELLDDSNKVKNSTEFRRVLESQPTKKFNIIQTLKDKIDYLLDRIFQYVADPEYTNTRSLFEKYQSIRSSKRAQRGGADTLFEYCSKVANNSLKDFLLETPLPYFSLIQEFEKDSNLDVIQSINEEYILKLFIVEHLKTYFQSKEMKEFYFHAKELFEKDKEGIYSNAKMFFVLQEIINTVRSDNRKIDVLRIKSKEFNSSFDYLNFILESHEYDFYNVAKKELLNTKPMNMTFKDNYIYISLTDKDDHVYDFNKNLTITVSDYKYKNDIYYVNDSMIYLFFILSTHFYLQSENLVDLDEYEEITNELESTVRKLKRLKGKDKRSIETLMKERKDFK